MRASVISSPNHALCKFYGKTESEVLGKTDFELMDEKAAAECRKTDEQTLRSNTLHISEETVGDRYYETRKFPVTIAGGKKGIGAYIRDITERKRLEDQLSDSLAKLQLTIDEAPVCVAMVGTDTRFLQCNKSFCDFLGYTSEEMKGRTIAQITFPEDKEVGMADLRAILAGGKRKPPAYRSDMCARMEGWFGVR